MLRRHFLALAGLLLAAQPIASAASGQEPETTRDEEIVFAALSAGDDFSCGLSSDGRAYCWGADWSGQLGSGGTVARCEEEVYSTGFCARAPVAVAGGHRFVSIATGSEHACAIDEEGIAWCWGQAHFGQLGVADQLDQCIREGSRRDEPVAIACSRSPVRVPLPGTVVSIDGGEFMTCAVDENGAAWCWPYGRGQPPMRVPLDAPLVSVSAGGSLVCGLTADEGIRCWSWPDVMLDDASAPTESIGWSALAVGAAHACALDADGRAWCWGSDRDAALGAGRTGHEMHEQLPLTPVLSDQRFHAIAAGAKRTCAIDLEGALHCWGRVAEAQADDECLSSNGVAGTNACTSRPVLVHPATRFSSVAVGASHQCALPASGPAVCWGTNRVGQLGNGSLRSTSGLAAVRTRGMSPAEMRRAAAREDALAFLGSGGFALLALAVLLLLFRPRLSVLRAPEMAAMWSGMGALTMLLHMARGLADRHGAGALVSAAAPQPVLIALGVTAWRLWVALREWWRAGDAAPAPATVGGALRGWPDAARAVGSFGGGTAAFLILAGWALVGLQVASSYGQRYDEVGGGLAVLAFLVAGTIALLLSIAGGTIALVRLRDSRSDTLARVALVLAAITVAGAAYVALQFFLAGRV